MWLTTSGNETVLFFKGSLSQIRLFCVIVVDRIDYNTTLILLKVTKWPCVILSTVNTDGQTLIMKGCATISFCRGDLSTQIGQSSSSLVELNCCEGHLCNSAQTVTPSRCFQLGLLLYAIIQTSFWAFSCVMMLYEAFILLIKSNQHSYMLVIMVN